MIVSYFNDLLNMSPSKEQLVNWPKKVLQKFVISGITLKVKFQLLVPSITFLAYQIDAAGIYPTQDKVKAIHSALDQYVQKILRHFWDTYIFISVS